MFMEGRVKAIVFSAVFNCRKERTVSARVMEARSSLEGGEGDVKVELVDETRGQLMMNFGGEGSPEEPKVFEYNSCFGMLSSQQDVFEECSGLVLSCLDGYNACVFAYGQTGAGKTWTMTGGEGRENWGLTRRMIDYL